MAVAYGTAGTLAGVTSGNITCAAPASIADGDLLIAVICANDTVTVSRTGWTALDNVSATSDTFKTSILWRIASGESGSYVFTHTGGSFCCGQVFRVTGTDQTTPINASSKKGSSTSGTSITSNTCTPTANNCLIFWAIGIDDNVVRVSSEAGGSLTWTEQVDAGNSTAALGICVATAPQTTAAGISPTATFSANNTFANLVLAIQPPVSGAISGTAAFTLGQSGTLTGAGALVGSSALTLGQTGTLAGSGSLAGSSALTLGQTGILTGSGALTGSAALSIGQSGTLSGAGALAGTTALSFGASATADVPSGAMSGTATLAFAGFGALIGDGALTGSGDIRFDANAIPDQQAQVPPGALDSPRIAEGWRRRKKKRSQVVPETPEVLEQPIEVVREPAQPVLSRQTQTLSDLTGQPDMATVDREIATLMRAIQERDDEEAIFAILSALDDF